MWNEVLWCSYKKDLINFTSYHVIRNALFYLNWYYCMCFYFVFIHLGTDDKVIKICIWKKIITLWACNKKTKMMKFVKKKRSTFIYIFLILWLSSERLCLIIMNMDCFYWFINYLECFFCTKWKLLFMLKCMVFSANIRGCFDGDI